jgi:hypothetical protein
VREAGLCCLWGDGRGNANRFVDNKVVVKRYSEGDDSGRKTDFRRDFCGNT